MIEQSQRRLVSSSPGDLETLQRRANNRRIRHRHARGAAQTRWQQVQAKLGSPVGSLSRLPTRYLLHALVVLILPLAVALSSVRPGALLPEARPAAPPQPSGDFVAPVAPLTLESEPMVGDAPLEDNGDIPVPLSLVSRAEALAPVTVPAAIAGQRINVRNGPGTNYDVVGRMSGGTKVQVIGRHGDWFQIRESVDKPIYWVSGELLNIPEAAIYTLFDVPDNAIPPPPPPKIGFVRENGTQLRDGPGTNYVSMASLIPGQIDLIERYKDWLYVSVAGNEGWVKAEFVDADPAVLKRLLESETIPDPNPAMVATISDNAVNLRKGPDSRYDRVTLANAGAQVSLLGKFKDWFKVQLGDGTKAWVFGDFLNATPHVLRRVKTTQDFPKLPVAFSARANGSAPRASADLARIAASGDVAGYATQFVGYRYVWGGASPGRGFDCSGLTSYVYRQVAGVGLPHNAAAQYSSAYGAFVGGMGNLAPGDLVFFRNTGGGRGITHVAIYIGGGRIVHAMTPRYGVQVSNLYESYWVSHYYGGLRVRR
jgi:cell wall-associated NlpC family hydrolase